MILAIESSCDDTCAAVVTGAGEIRSNVISSQGVHDRYGGVVPEVASRHHLELATPVVDDSLAQAGGAPGPPPRALTEARGRPPRGGAGRGGPVPGASAKGRGLGPKGVLSHT